MGQKDIDGYCVGHRARGHTFGQYYEAGSPFPCATGNEIGSYCLCFRSPAYTLLRFAFLLPTVSLGSFLIPYFFFDFHSSLTINLRPAPSLHVSKSGSFTLQKSVKCGKFVSLSACCLADFVVVSSTSLVCASFFCIWSWCCCGSCSCHMWEAEKTSGPSDWTLYMEAAFYSATAAVCKSHCPSKL